MQKHQELRPHEADLAARLESFELAYRMQAAAPEAMDVNQESEATHRGVRSRPERHAAGRQAVHHRAAVDRTRCAVRAILCRHQRRWRRCGDVPWDGHNDIGVNHRIAAKSVDQPIGALLADLKSRGLLDETLVVWGGEFGRTSDSQGSKGRDHNPHAFTMWMAGGGIQGGVQYGASDEFRLQSRRETRRRQRPARDDSAPAGSRP